MVTVCKVRISVVLGPRRVLQGIWKKVWQAGRQSLDTMGKNGVRRVEERRVYQHGLRGLRGRKQGALRRAQEASSSLLLQTRPRVPFLFFPCCSGKPWFVQWSKNEENKKNEENIHFNRRVISVQLDETSR
jgi:hypothetical protein